MIAPEYTAPKLNPLTRREGAHLTVAMGSAHVGDDYHNADVFGKVLHFGGVNYLEAERDRDPRAFTSKVEVQVEQLQELITPYIGRWAAAKHEMLGVKRESAWETWRSYDRPKVMHTSGIILGVAGVVMNRRVIFGYNHPAQSSQMQNIRRGDFKIGVLLDTTDASPAFSYGVEAPETDRMLVPVRGFPRRGDSFSYLWSWQLSGTDRN
jgi:hypothetical protein